MPELKKREPTEVLYVRVSVKNKKFVAAEARKHEVTVTAYIDHIIDCARLKGPKRKQLKSASNKRKSK